MPSPLPSIKCKGVPLSDNDPRCSLLLLISSHATGSLMNMMFSGDTS